MQISITYRTLLLMVLIVFGTSCRKVVVTVDGIPGNTPNGQPVFITGNFNNWDPGDDRYRMQLDPDSTYRVTLPPGFGTIEYKFTRGDWTTVEKDLCGYEIDNRRIVIGESDTVMNFIASWSDLAPLNCPRLTILVKEMPESTLPEEDIVVVGNFNGWSADSSSILSRSSNGNYFITIERPAEIEELEFKLTRGDMASAESDEFGNMVPNRILRFGVKDTIELKIEGWIDRVGKKGNRVVILIDKLPPNTGRNSEIYLAGSMNGWMAGDKNYMFMVNQKGQLYYPLARKKNPFEFKVTRGSWNAVEVDKYGYDIPNRYMIPEHDDTVHIEIAGWKDFPHVTDSEVTVVIDQLPVTTPEGEKLYITGSINGWDPGESKYSFTAGPDGRPLINLPRKKGLLEFKISRGSFPSMEVNEYGSQIPYRIYYYKDIDTLHITVQNWMDRPPYDLQQVTLVLDGLPSETPPLDNIFLAPDFNDWNPGDLKQVFRYLPDGKPYLTIKRNAPQFEFKITRGSWDNVETDSNGDPIPNRMQVFGFADTVYLQVAAWRDFGGRY